MYTRNTKLLALSVMSTLLVAGSACADNRQATENLLDDYFSVFTTENEPGVAVMLIQNGEIRLQKCFGLANLEDNTLISADTAFRLASVSKQFAAMAIMILEEEGKLAYDDPIAKFIPELAPYGDVTIRHLLQHTGGLPDYYPVIDTSAGMPTNAEAATVLGQMASPLFNAGQRYEYSNPGYDMLGPIVEAASGVPFVRFVEERIFEPAGMKSSVVHDHTLPAIQNRATGYDPAPEGFALNDADPLNGIVGSGGIYTTLNDMYRWDQALYSDVLVSQDTLDLAYSPAHTNSGEVINYGFGWRLDEFEGHKRVRHGGSWVGFRTHIARIPELRFTIVMLSNRSDFEPDSYIDKLTETWLGLVN
jgi:CubicO group peptidase (beta-lactamase class C family)